MELNRHACVPITDIDVLVSKIVAEVKALESKGGDQGAENSEYTFLAAVETAPQFHCPVCGNRVGFVIELARRVCVR